MKPSLPAKLPASQTQEQYHKTVLINEVLTYLSPQPGKLYLDATFGGGGHTRAILEKEPECRVIALDWDKEAIKRNAITLQEEFGDRLTVIWGNFIHLDRILEKEGITSIDGALADFGTSQFQIHEKEGFSFQTDTPLDMRMSPAHQYVTAADLLNKLSEKELADIFYKYGEETRSRALARAIVAARQQKKITTTGQLVHLVESVIPFFKRRGKMHPATRAFQALRIEVNHELDNIERFLKVTLPLITPQGRVVCISFHSLEDRIVKYYFRERRDELTILTPKPVTATPEELMQNPSSRSAKLRAAQKEK